MASHLGVLSTGSTAATTEVKGDVDSGPPRRCCRRVRQRPPPKLYKTSMVGPLGVLTVGSAAATTEVVGDVDGGLPGGGVPAGPAAVTTFTARRRWRPLGGCYR
jgi:hypothetical protein